MWNKNCEILCICIGFDMNKQWKTNKPHSELWSAQSLAEYFFLSSVET